MIVNDLDIQGIAVGPAKAEAPTVVDADAVLAFAIANQRLQSVSGWDSEVLHLPGLMEIEELSPRHTLDGPEPRHVEIVEQGFRPGVAEGPDHPS